MTHNKVMHWSCSGLFCSKFMQNAPGHFNIISSNAQCPYYSILGITFWSELCYVIHIEVFISNTCFTHMTTIFMRWSIKTSRGIQVTWCATMEQFTDRMWQWWIAIKPKTATQNQDMKSDLDMIKPINNPSTYVVKNINSYMFWLHQ